MENMDGLYGNGLTKLLGMRVVKLLESREYSLLSKLDNVDSIIGRYSYEKHKIRELRKGINFIKWLINNSTKDEVQKLIKTYSEEEERYIETEDECEINSKKPIVYRIFSPIIKKNKRLEVQLSRNEDTEFICLNSLRRNKEKNVWKRIGSVRVTKSMLEKILRWSYEETE